MVRDNSTICVSFPIKQKLEELKKEESLKRGYNVTFSAVIAILLESSRKEGG